MKSQQREHGPTDRELVEACLENSRQAQRALYEKFKIQLYTLVYRLVNDHDAGNDIIQDAFIEIFRSMKSFRFESSLYTWMRTIVIRNAMSYLKKASRLHLSEDEIPELPVQGAFNFTAEHLEKAILSLPDQARSVFVLIEIEGYKHREVSDMLNISEGTSKSQLNYARKLLRTRLATAQYE